MILVSYLKSKIFKNLSILLSFGLIVKVLGLFHRIILTRKLSLEGLSLYAKMMPISTLFCVLASFSLGPTITQMVAKNITKRPYSNRDLMIKGFKLATITASIVSIIHLLTNHLITHYLLQTDELFKPFIFFIPLYYLQSYTGVFKGYFHGHNKMDTYAIGQLIEQVIRIILIYLLITPALNQSLASGIIATVISLSIGELCQNIYLLICLLKMTKIKNKTNIKADNKAIISTSFNLTSSRLTNALCNFFEPIIFTYAFLKTGMDKSIADELYGIIYGYALPLIFITSFVTAAIETAILPELVTNHKKNDSKAFHSVLNKALCLSFIPAIATTTIFYFYSKEMLELFYHTTDGSYYIKLLAIPSFLSYFDGVFIAALMAANQEKKLAKINILTNLIYLFSIFILVQIPAINVMGIIISLIIYMTISPLIYFKLCQKEIHYRLPKIAYLFIISYVIAIISLKISQNIIIPVIIYLFTALGLVIRKKYSHHWLDN